MTPKNKNEEIKREIEIKPYWNFEGFFPRYIKKHNRTIFFDLDRIVFRKKILKEVLEKK